MQQHSVQNRSKESHWGSGGYRGPVPESSHLCRGQRHHGQALWRQPVLPPGWPGVCSVPGVVGYVSFLCMGIPGGQTRAGFRRHGAPVRPQHARQLLRSWEITLPAPLPHCLMPERQRLNTPLLILKSLTTICADQGSNGVLRHPTLATSQLGSQELL